jgi:hypothetical protein
VVGQPPPVGARLAGPTVAPPLDDLPTDVVNGLRVLSGPPSRLWVCHDSRSKEGSDDVSP